MRARVVRGHDAAGCGIEQNRLGRRRSRVHSQDQRAVGRRLPGRRGDDLHPVGVAAERRESAEARLDRDVRRLVARLVAGEQGAAPGLEPRALRQHDELRAGSFSRRAASIAALRVTPPITSTRRSSRWPFSSSATTLLAMLSCSVCRMSSGVASLRLSLWVMSDLQWTEQRRGQRHDLALERAPDRLLDGQPHPADLLHEELAAAGGAFVVRQDVGDPAVGEEIDQEGLAAQRGHGVELAAVHLAQRPLNGGDFGDVAHGRTRRNTRRRRTPRRAVPEDFQRAALMGHDPCQYPGASECTTLTVSAPTFTPTTDMASPPPAFKLIFYSNNPNCLVITTYVNFPDRRKSLSSKPLWRLVPTKLTQLIPCQSFASTQGRNHNSFVFLDLQRWCRRPAKVRQGSTSGRRSRPRRSAAFWREFPSIYLWKRATSSKATTQPAAGDGTTR